MAVSFLEFEIVGMVDVICGKKNKNYKHKQAHSKFAQLCTKVKGDSFVMSFAFELQFLAWKSVLVVQL